MSGNVLVRDIMTKNVKTIRQDTTLHEVIATFSSLDLDSLVVEKAGQPIGIVTTKDALTRGFEHGMPVSAITAGNVMTSPVETIEEEATAEEAVEKMGRAHIKHLPVVRDGKLVGILSDTDIMLAVPAMIGQMEEVCRPQAAALH
jgi:CBS domain-containing protein